jgi:hypothetical protein
MIDTAAGVLTLVQPAHVSTEATRNISRQERQGRKVNPSDLAIFALFARELFNLDSQCAGGPNESISRQERQARKVDDSDLAIFALFARNLFVLDS